MRLWTPQVPLDKNRFFACAGLIPNCSNKLLNRLGEWCELSKEKLEKDLIIKMELVIDSARILNLIVAGVYLISLLLCHPYLVSI